MKKTLQLIICMAMILIPLEAEGIKDSGLPEIGCAIYKFDDTFMTGVRNSITSVAKGKAKIT